MITNIPRPAIGEAYKLNIGDGFFLNVGDGYVLLINPSGDSIINTARPASGQTWATIAETWDSVYYDWDDAGASVNYAGYKPSQTPSIITNTPRP